MNNSNRTDGMLSTIKEERISHHIKTLHFFIVYCEKNTELKLNQSTDKSSAHMYTTPPSSLSSSSSSSSSSSLNSTLNSSPSFSSSSDYQVLKAPSPLNDVSSAEIKKGKISKSLLEIQNKMETLINCWFNTIIFQIFYGLPTKKGNIYLSIPIPYYFEDFKILLLLCALENGINLKIDKKHKQNSYDTNKIYIDFHDENCSRTSQSSSISFKSIKTIESKTIDLSNWIKTLENLYPTDEQNWDLAYSIGHLSLCDT